MFNEEYTKLATVEYFGPVQDEPGYCLLVLSAKNQVVRAESLRFLRSLPETLAHKASKKDKSNRMVWAINQRLLPLIGQYFLIEQWIAARMNAQQIAAARGRQAVSIVSDFIASVEQRNKN